MSSPVNPLKRPNPFNEESTTSPNPKKLKVITDNLRDNPPPSSNQTPFSNLPDNKFSNLANESTSFPLIDLNELKSATLRTRPPSLPSVKPLICEMNAKKMLEAQGYEQDKDLDLPRAFKLYNELASINCTHGLIAAAKCLIFGRGVIVDGSRALEYLKKAFKQTLTDEQKGTILWLMGTIFEVGYYIEKKKLIQDLAAAEDYYQGSSRVKNHPNSFGCYCLASIFYNKGKHNKSAEIMKEYNIILNLNQLANKGDPIAQFYLSRCFEKGQGVPQDPTTALELLKKSADQNLIFAQFYLSLHYLKVDNQDSQTQGRILLSKALSKAGTDINTFQEVMNIFSKNRRYKIFKIYS